MGGGCHVVGAPPDMHCACVPPPIALFTPIFAHPCDRSEVIHQILGDLHIIWSRCHTHRSRRSDFEGAAQFQIDTALMTDRPPCQAFNLKTFQSTKDERAMVCNVEYLRPIRTKYVLENPMIPKDPQ